MARIMAALALVLLALQGVLWWGPRSARIAQLQQQILQQQHKNQQLQRRNQAVEAEVFSLKQDLEAIEARARNELGLIKPGETFFQIIE